MFAFPCRKMLREVGSSPFAVRTTVSGLVEPAPESEEPPVPIEFSQPCPTRPALLHGQGMTPGSWPSPKQYAVAGPMAVMSSRPGPEPATCPSGFVIVRSVGPVGAFGATLRFTVTCVGPFQAIELTRIPGLEDEAWIRLSPGSVS